MRTSLLLAVFSLGSGSRGCASVMWDLAACCNKLPLKSPALREKSYNDRAVCVLNVKLGTVAHSSDDMCPSADGERPL